MDASPTTALLEIRTYRLKPGTTAAFHATVTERAAPLLHQYGIDVVRTGPSEQNEDGVEEYVLIRSFASTAERDEQEERFYSSPDWHDGPRTDVMSRIENYHTIVLSVPVAAVDALRNRG